MSRSFDQVGRFYEMGRRRTPLGGWLCTVSARRTEAEILGDPGAAWHGSCYRFSQAPSREAPGTIGRARRDAMLLRFRVEVEELSGVTYLESAFSDRGKAVARAARLARPFRSVKVTDLAENRLVESVRAVWDRRLPPSAVPTVPTRVGLRPAA